MYVVYPIPVEAGIVKLRSPAYATLGALRSLPFKCDQNAGTAACIDVIKTMLDHKFPRPGCHAILLYCVFHRVVIQVTGRQRRYIQPVGSYVFNTVSKMELIAKVIFLGAQNDGHSASTVFTKAWEHAFHCARRGLVREDTTMPLFIVADGFQLELFDSVQQCLYQPRRLNTFDAPSAAIVSDIPDNALASDLLKVLARSPDNCRYLEDIRQAMVFPPVPHAPKPIGFRHVILWLSDHNLDISPLATVWTGCDRLTIKHEILAGYWDLIRLRDMHALSNNDTESPSYSSLSDLHRTAGRGGRGG